jgi:hypothetical protein
MKIRLLFIGVVLISMFFAPVAHAQWQCYYATWDNEANGTGHNTTSVGVVQENIFVALVMTPDTRNFMVPYINADSGFGRIDFYGYGSSATDSVYQLWTDGAFDQVVMYNARNLDATPDGDVFVANNDDNHNILVWTLDPDTILPKPPYRVETGGNGIFGIHVSEMGYVFVCNDTSNGVSDDVKIYPPYTSWSGPTMPPMATIDLPDGIYKGITTTPDANWVFISDYGNRKILKYTGTPATGYTQDTGFDFQLSPGDTVIPSTTNIPSVLGLAYLTPNNILFAAVDAYLPNPLSSAYSYGRMYLINPVTGDFVSQDTSVSVIDVAEWNFEKTGSYSDRGDGTQPGNASGYTSTYDVDFDESGNLYSQSHYGWTVEKWAYMGTLPTVTINSVRDITKELPESFSLRQNYPNPFNPATNIEFSIPVSSHVSLTVCNVLGEQVATLLDEFKESGTYQVRFDARNLPSGTYLYTLRTNGFVEMKKMMLVR